MSYEVAKEINGWKFNGESLDTENTRYQFDAVDPEGQIHNLLISLENEKYGLCFWINDPEGAGKCLGTDHEGGFIDDGDGFEGYGTEPFTYKGDLDDALASASAWITIYKLKLKASRA